MPSVHASFYTDPFCGWSWAAEPLLRRLEVEFGEQVRITYVMGGLAGELTDPQALARQWLDAAAHSAMPVDPRPLLGDPPRSTHPACMAVVAVAEQADPDPFLRHLRRALLVRRRRAADAGALLDLAREAGVPDLARLRIDLGSAATLEGFSAQLQRFRDASVPLGTLVFEGPGGGRVDAHDPWESWRATALASGAQGMPDAVPSVLEAIRRWAPLATPEVAAACDLAGPRARAELWRLAVEWRVRPEPVLGGELWAPA